MTQRANYCCPSCDSSDIVSVSQSTYECRDCGQQVHEAIAENKELLDRLKSREDKAGEIAETLLETGGIDE